ncbi:MAG: hypothetical protein BYD32DRAFT_216986 [Podila humilis]|nr:MAG: hypothetical protein BYD32DRAFT_216986 [Podila humilis]
MHLDFMHLTFFLAVARLGCPLLFLVLAFSSISFSSISFSRISFSSMSPFFFCPSPDIFFFSNDFFFEMLLIISVSISLAEHPLCWPLGLYSSPSVSSHISLSLSLSPPILATTTKNTHQLPTLHK